MVLLRGYDRDNKNTYTIFGLDKNDIGKLQSGATGRFKGRDKEVGINYVFFYEDDEKLLCDRVVKEFPNAKIQE